MHRFAIAATLFFASCSHDVAAPVDGGAPDVPAPRDLFAYAAGAGPPFPLVLVHGMGGFRNLGPLEYWFHVPELYRRQGAKFYVAQMTTLASIEQRAHELKAQLDGIEGPFILVGHSQGGLDARYLVTKLGYAERVRAVVTIATPHHGSPVADVLIGDAPGVVIDVANVLIGLLGWSLDGAKELTTSYMDRVFNPTVPDAPGVAYWSFAGHASPLALEDGTGWLHAVLVPTWTAMKAAGLESDGVVPVESQKWGRFVSIVKADHIGEVNQPLGETPEFHAMAFYGGLLTQLHDAGF